MHKCAKCFSPSCPTVLHNAMINYAHIKASNETALEINSYGHWLHLVYVLLRDIFLGQKSDLLPCSSAIGRVVYTYFQSNVKLTFFQCYSWEKVEKMEAFAPWKMEHNKAKSVEYYSAI